MHELLQIPDYARALFVATGQIRRPEDIERQVKIRQERQQAVARRSRPLRITAVFGAGALAQQVGGPDVMDRQRDHLRQLAAQPNMDLRVLTAGSGAYAAIHTGAFTVLRFDDPEDPEVVYFEALTGARYTENRTRSTHTVVPSSCPGSSRYR